ncbi:MULTISPECIES: DUF3995 domain-containing protein [Streptomyces]|uniref:DUF3995 domain-containing protein n=1 Tax=Streptomyces TaxID=1883 RepID=UPI00163C5354|nr:MULTISPECIES: DUF3995 domain-containing protein [Streptomyces]MBC2879286.1 DUF3995 domain-containing protein [Streptomyces sp. TYQ1024]UBI40115.1 DUF3995 domain-containing protein [Streptomyces mobaraensis]UKW32694.1 DUF3995 domain-containing protein [Streptomyces sp. TYQ1024]
MIERYVHAVPRRPSRPRPGAGPGLAAAVWGILFAVPSFVWATGRTFGARTTVSPSLVELAHDRVTWFVAVLWVTGFLKLIGALLGIGLTRRRGPGTGRLLVFCGGGAAVLLVWHGGLFVLDGVLVETGVLSAAPGLADLTLWYLCLWGPWFVAGGLAFGAATARYVRHRDTPREVRLSGAAGALGALVLSLASTVTGIG